MSHLLCMITHIFVFSTKMDVPFISFHPPEPYIFLIWERDSLQLKGKLREHSTTLPPAVPPHPGVTACPEPKLQLWAVSYLRKPSQVSGARSRRLPQHNEKQLSAPCRTTPAVHKQSFVSPPLDSISFYLPPSVQICSKGRWYLSRKEMYSGSNLLLRLNSLTPRTVCSRN